MKYACITLYQREFPVRLMCRVLEVAPSGYYAWRKQPTCAHAIADERLLLHVRGAHGTSGGRYGAPRVHRELRAAVSIAIRNSPLNDISNSPPRVITPQALASRRGGVTRRGVSLSSDTSRP